MEMDHINTRLALLFFRSIVKMLDYKVLLLPTLKEKSSYLRSSFSLSVFVDLLLIDFLREILASNFCSCVLIYSSISFLLL